MKKKIAVLTSGWAVDYVLSVIEGMNKSCQMNNADLYIFTCYKFVEPSGASNTTSFTVFDLIDYKDYDGIVFMPNLFNDDDMVKKYTELIRKSGVPAVAIGMKIPGFHYVASDNKVAASELVLHVVQEHGAKRFAFLGGPEGDSGTEDCYQIICNSLRDGGLNPESAILHYGHTDWTFNTAYEISNKIFENKIETPNAVICSNPSIAMAVTKAASEKGFSIPEDVIVISFEDNEYSTRIMPSLSAVNINPERIGEVCIETLLSGAEECTSKVVTGSIFKRQSCGCKRKITVEQKIYSQGFVKELDREQRFASQLRFIEDRFIQDQTVPELCDDLQKYYTKRHFFEGPDFALFIDKNVMDNITEALTDSNNYISYGKKMQTIVNLENGQPAPQVIIDKKQLLPPNMFSDKSSMYLFLPIFVQQYVYGYYVSKNCNSLLLNKAAYNWTRNVGNSIEKYRQTSVYRRMSEQLQVLSTQDALSGLLNRAGLHNFGTELFINNNENNLPTEVIFVDINDMKIINDKFGHLQGDLAIKTVAEAISTSIPEDYIAVRYGGDEYLIIGNPKTNEDYCGKITDELQNKAIQMSLPYKLTVSIGCKTFEPKETEILTDAINIVDKIMYQKKAEYHKNNG